MRLRIGQRRTLKSRPKSQHSTDGRSIEAASAKRNASMSN
jgi:hypothetical protein